MLANVVYLCLPHQVGKVNIHRALYSTGFTMEAYIDGATGPINELVEVIPWCPDIVTIGKGVTDRAVLIIVWLYTLARAVASFLGRW